MKKLRRILLTNSHSANAGDAAIILSMLDHIRFISHSCEIVAQCSHPDVSRRLAFREGVEYHGYPAPFFEASGGAPSAARLAYGGLVFLNNMLSAAAYRLLGAKLFLINAPYREPLEDFFRSDIVISVGGGFISADYGFIRPYADIAMAKILGKRVVIYSQSIGPFCGPLNEAISRFVLGMADLIMVRESRSARNLEAIGIRRVHVTADAAFSYPEMPPRAERGNTVVICPREWTYSNRIHSERYISLIGELSSGIINELGMEVLLLPTTPDDVAFYSRLAPSLPAGVRFVSEVHHPSKIAELLSSSAFLVSSRMHPIVLGSLSSTPFFALGWEYKLRELCSDFSVEDMCLMAGEADGSAVARVLSAIRSSEGVRKRISESFPEVRRRSTMNRDLLKKSIAEWGYGD